jgi:hypothetical protein
MVMPRPRFHAVLPGPAAGGGPFDSILRLLMFGLAIVFALFFLLLALVLGAFFLLLRAFGLGPRMPSPKVPFGFPGQAMPPTDPSMPAGAADVQARPGSREEKVKELEEFHGSLDEYLKHKKRSDHR